MWEFSLLNYFFGQFGKTCKIGKFLKNYEFYLQPHADVRVCDLEFAISIEAFFWFAL